MPFVRTRRAMVMLTVATSLTYPSAAAGNGTTPSPEDGNQIAVYALSRGQGVPEATRAALDKVRVRFESLQENGAIIRIDERRIGLEGEIRICAVFTSKDAARAEWSRLEDLIAGLDLAELKFEPCDRQP